MGSCACQSDKSNAEEIQRKSSRARGRMSESPLHAIRHENSSMPPIQARLTVGAAHDAFEQEADRIADEVMRMPAPVSAHTHAQDGTAGLEHGVQRDAAEGEELQRKPLAASITPLLQRQPLQREGLEDEELQRDAMEEDELQRMGGDEGFEADEGSPLKEEDTKKDEVFVCWRPVDDPRVKHLADHSFFRVGGKQPSANHETFSLFPNKTSPPCWQGKPFLGSGRGADIDKQAACTRSSITLAELMYQFSQYPVGKYCAAGPNSNTFVGSILRKSGANDVLSPSPFLWGWTDDPPSAGSAADAPGEGCDECLMPKFGKKNSETVSRGENGGNEDGLPPSLPA